MRALNISGAQTQRRDLDLLQKQEVLRRVYGGAVLQWS